MKSVEVQLTITAITAANLTSGGLVPLMVTDFETENMSVTRHHTGKQEEG